jgi:hypothetical protein
LTLAQVAAGVVGTPLHLHLHLLALKVPLGDHADIL